MSTSSSPALGERPGAEVQPFQYAELELHAATGKTAPSEGALQAVREAATREAGRQEGEAQARAAYNTHLEEIRDSVRTAVADFAMQRTRYFQQVEGEVVQLALSIARKVLHRESQLDPLLLAGMVRVALEKIEAGTKVAVRVHPQQVSECRGYFAHHMDAHNVPEVLEDPAVAMDHCLLQTALGSTELGLEVQLKEIEQGLFDLLARRPAGA